MNARVLRLILRFLVLFTLTCVPSVCFGQVSASDDAGDPRAVASRWAKQLGNYDPAVRQEAAEALARLAAVEQRKLVQGYHFQEKNKNVRLALEWTLYRMGKSDMLFQIVHELDSGRHDQAVGYLSKVDTPALLHSYLKDEDKPARITAGLIEALAVIGDQESLVLITPFRNSFLPGVAAAAEDAIDKIEARLGQSDPAKPTRPRTVGGTENQPSTN